MAGKKEGKGIFRYINGDWYKGFWKAGAQHGEGTHYFKQQCCWYIGTWENGQFVRGEWKLKDGSVYNGNFKDGKPAAGEATFVLRSGIKQLGKWHNKKLPDGKTEVVWVAAAPTAA